MRGKGRRARPGTSTGCARARPGTSGYCVRVRPGTSGYGCRARAGTPGYVWVRRLSSIRQNRANFHSYMFGLVSFKIHFRVPQSAETESQSQCESSHPNYAGADLADPRAVNKPAVLTWPMWLR